ncbi:MAG: glycerophosphoryl diester phosphodiesterase [Chloroflexota bacterium]|nr:glycerophosphoryl diester phosphodiesterase [Chloroflexota bacterium]
MSRRVDNPWRRSAPLALAHRGQRATVPEQTLDAYETAIRLGADGVETDVQLTADGRLAMIHDLTVDRTTNGRGPVAAHDWAELRSLDAGSWFSEAFVGCRIPSLEETIELIVGAGVVLCVEIKGDGAVAPRTAAAVARIVRARGLVDQVFISSFDHAALAVARTALGAPLLAPERLPEAGPSDPQTAAAQAIALDAAVLQHRWEDLTPEVAAALHEAGTAIWTWPIDDPIAIQRSVELGADGIIGDDVALLLAGLGRAAPPAAAAGRP